MNYDEHKFDDPKDEHLTEEFFNQRVPSTIIIIEGVDRTGKTTLQERLKKHYQYRHLTIVRGPVGMKAYNEIYDRSGTNGYLDLMEQSFKKLGAIMIYLYADEKVIKKRLEEEIGAEKIDVKYNQRVYDQYYNWSSLNKFKINTGQHNLDGVFNLVVNKIDEYLKNKK